MKGWSLFVHSVRQVFGNLGAALRISGLLYLVQIAVSLVLGVSLMGDDADLQAKAMAGEFPWGGLVVVVLVALISGLWIAVAWHRYVLLNEPQGTLIPTFRADRILSYLGHSLLLLVVLIPVGAVMGLVAGLLLTPLMMAGGEGGIGALFALGILVYLPMIVICYRLCVMLPAAALGQPMGVGAAWGKTKGASGDILVLAVISVAVAIVIGLPDIFVFAPGSVLSMAWNLITQWVVMMVGVSILTTIYGHYVEGRALV